MKFTQADYDFYTVNFNNAFFERAKNEKETLGELKIELEVMANYVSLLGGPVKIDCLVMPKTSSLRLDQLPYYGPKGAEGFAFDTIDTLEIPKGVKKIYAETFFDFASNVFNKIWKLNRLILPSTGLTEINELSFAGLMPKEIYLRGNDGELTTASRRFRIIQGKDSGRSDGCAILVDLKTATRLIPSATPLREYSVLKKEFPQIAAEWQAMPYEDFVELSLLCRHFSTPHGDSWRYEHRHGKNDATLNDFKNAVFNVKPGQSPDGEFSRRNNEITKEVFERISRYSKQISDAILANRIEEEFIKANRLARSFFDENVAAQKDMPSLTKEKFKAIKEAREKIASQEQEFRAKYFIARLKELSAKHNALLHTTILKEKYSRRMYLQYEIIKGGIFIEKEKVDLDFAPQFKGALENLQKKLEALA